jgi:hypothetical protein
MTIFSSSETGVPFKSAVAVAGVKVEVMADQAQRDIPPKGYFHTSIGVGSNS